MPPVPGRRYTQGMDDRRQTLDSLVRRIVETVHPLRIILFGSCARGDARPDSDVDLLVVMPDGTHRRHTAQRLYREIQDIDVAFDLVVATSADLVKHRNTPGYVYKTALREGRDVYAQGSRIWPLRLTERGTPLYKWYRMYRMGHVFPGKPAAEGTRAAPRGQPGQMRGPCVYAG